MKGVSPILWGIFGLTIIATLTSQIFILNDDLKQAIWNNGVNLFELQLHNGHVNVTFREECFGAESCAKKSCHLLQEETLNLVGIHFQHQQQSCSDLSIWTAMEKYRPIYFNVMVAVLEIGISIVLSTIVSTILMEFNFSNKWMLWIWIFSETMRYLLLFFGLLLNSAMALIWTDHLANIQVASLLITNIGLSIFQHFGFFHAWRGFLYRHQRLKDHRLKAQELVQNINQDLGRHIDKGPAPIIPTYYPQPSAPPSLSVTLQDETLPLISQEVLFNL